MNNFSCIFYIRRKIIIELFYLNDSEEKLDEQYNKLKQRVLAWYEMINTKSENGDLKFNFLIVGIPFLTR